MWPESFIYFDAVEVTLFNGSRERIGHHFLHILCDVCARTSFTKISHKPIRVYKEKRRDKDLYNKRVLTRHIRQRVCLLKINDCSSFKLSLMCQKVQFMTAESLSHLPSLSLAASHALLGPFISHS